MSPTEIFANQHYNLAKKIFPSEINLELFTGKTNTSNKEAKLYQIYKNSNINMIFGTHSLAQKKTIFNKLGFIIIDEQHKFGVKQRKLLSDPGGSNCDMLINVCNSNTKSINIDDLAGDMDLSIINEKPKNRKEIITYSKNEDNIKDVIDFVKKEIYNKNQIFGGVMPLIDESKKIDVSRLYRDLVIKQIISIKSSNNS